MIQRITKYINQRGITQAEFARRTKVRQDNLWRWLKGVSVIPSDKYEAIDIFLKNEGY